MKLIGVISLLSLATTITASALAPRQYTNSTTPGSTTKSLLQSNGKWWKLFGCAENRISWTEFALVSTSPTQTIEQCLSNCPSSARYAGLFENNCYCATNTNNATVAIPDSKCTIQCSGDASEACGGFAPAAVNKRDLVVRQATPGPNMLLTLYTIVEIIPPAIYISIVITEYFEICATGLKTVTYTETQTNTHCGCLDYTPAASVAMTTSVGSCGCGPGGAQKTWTVTVPVAVIGVGATGTIGGAPGKAAFTGGANSASRGAAGVALVGAGVFAAAMM